MLKSVSLYTQYVLDREYNTAVVWYEKYVPSFRVHFQRMNYLYTI